MMALMIQGAGVSVVSLLHLVLLLVMRFAPKLWRAADGTAVDIERTGTVACHVAAMLLWPLGALMVLYESLIGLRGVFRKR